MGRATRGSASLERCSAGATPPAQLIEPCSRSAPCCSPSISRGSGSARGDLLLDAGCGEGRHCFGALERGARVVGLDLDLDSLRKGGGPLRARGRSSRSLRRDAARRRVPAALPRRHLRPRDLRRGDGARARLPRPPRASSRASREPGGRHRRHDPDRDQRAALPAPRRRLLREPGGHIRIFRPRDLARALAAAGLRTRGRGFAHGLHTPYWALRSIAGLPRADASRLVRAYRLFLIRATDVALRRTGSRSTC